MPAWFRTSIKGYGFVHGREIKTLFSGAFTCIKTGNNLQFSGEKGKDFPSADYDRDNNLFRPLEKMEYYAIIYLTINLNVN